MARIYPFKGIVYNPDRIQNLGDVTTPPYDVISEAEQAEFYNRHPHNIIRLILGKTRETDHEGNNRHTRAAASFRQWLSDGVLIQDGSPAIYLTEMTFMVNQQPFIRWGIIARVGLEPFDKKVILPHETTFSRVKSERLKLMNAGHANFSPIFSLYSDPTNHLISMLRQAVEGIRPMMDFIDDRSQSHRVWNVTDSTIHQYILNFMGDRPLFIADGHHRYETALNYQNQMAAGSAAFMPDHPSNFVMMYLSAMEDPGLLILPAHRIVRKADPDQINRILDLSSRYFEIGSVSAGSESGSGNYDSLMRAMQTDSERTVIGVCIQSMPDFLILRLKPGVMKSLYGEALPKNVLSLDVTVLTRLVLMDIMGMNAAQLDDENQIAYSSSVKTAVKSVTENQSAVSFLLNPTRIDQVRQIAEAGEIMPRKSTYFYPKVITGLTINALF
ncbi:MAG: DUF1015 domain-containing protein [Desulfatirhabdiaceae bacterium]